MKAIIDGNAINYTVDGESGPWLVLSHSLGCTLEMWAPQMASLTSRYRVLRYETRGHGSSDGPPGAYSLDMLADDARGLMDHLHILQAHWIGFSMGGMIGQTFALKYPDRLSSLVLADTTSAHSATPVSMWDERIRTAKEHGMQPLVQPAINRWFTEPFRQSHPNVVAEIAQMIRDTSINGWTGCCAAIAAIHTTDHLHKINCPALVMVGEKDIGTPLAGALDMHRNLTDSILVVISDAAHMSNIEQPRQFNRALRLFLDALS